MMGVDRRKNNGNNCGFLWWWHWCWHAGWCDCDYILNFPLLKYIKRQWPKTSSPLFVCGGFVLYSLFSVCRRPLWLGRWSAWLLISTQWTRVSPSAYSSGLFLLLLIAESARAWVINSNVLWKSTSSRNAEPCARSNEGMYGGEEATTPVTTAFVQEIAEGKTWWDCVKATMKKKNEK